MRTYHALYISVGLAEMFDDVTVRPAADGTFVVEIFLSRAWDDLTLFLYIGVDLKAREM